MELVAKELNLVMSQEFYNMAEWLQNQSKSIPKAFSNSGRGVPSQWIECLDVINYPIKVSSI